MENKDPKQNCGFRVEIIQGQVANKEKLVEETSADLGHVMPFLQKGGGGRIPLVYSLQQNPTYLVGYHVLVEY